jgi:hypothetical protein
MRERDRARHPGRGTPRCPRGRTGKRRAATATRRCGRWPVVCGESALEALNAQQLGKLAFLLECAVRRRVTRRSFDSWLAQLAERDDRHAAAEALRARLVEKVNEVELGGRREAA